MNFKDQLKSDLKTVFLNTKEFGELLNVFYAGESYIIPGVIDYTDAQDRKRLRNDNVDGITEIAAKLYLDLSDLKITPRQGASIEVGDDVYKIARSITEFGQIILDLERLDE